MQMKLEVTHWEKTHKLVTSGFPELDNPVFIHNSMEQNLIQPAMQGKHQGLWNSVVFMIKPDLHEDNSVIILQRNQVLILSLTAPEITSIRSGRRISPGKHWWVYWL